MLLPGGTLHFVSDVAGYFDETCAMLAEQGLLRRGPPLPDTAQFLTNFERKYRREGRPFYALAARKKRTED